MPPYEYGLEDLDSVAMHTSLGRRSGASERHVRETKTDTRDWSSRLRILVVWNHCSRLRIRKSLRTSLSRQGFSTAVPDVGGHSACQKRFVKETQTAKQRVADVEGSNVPCTVCLHHLYLVVPSHLTSS